MQAAMEQTVTGITKSQGTGPNPEDFSRILLNGKVPIEKDWQRYCVEKRTLPEGRVNGHNIGNACGPASNCIVLDVDDPGAFKNACEQNGWTVPATFTVQTGSGKPHYYYQYPQDGSDYGNRICKPLGFDIRGKGGQVVAPGSIHPDTGKPYRIVKNIAIASAPTWLLNLYKKDSQQAPLIAAPNRYAATALANELTALSCTSKGCRNDQLNRSAHALGQLVAGGELEQCQVERALTAAAVGIGLSHSEIKVTIASGISSGMASPRKAPEKIRQAVDGALSGITSSSGAGPSPQAWGAPQPLIAKVDAAPYPMDALPAAIREAVEEVRAFVKAPAPLVAASALSALSLAVQGQVDVGRAEGLSGPVSLFILAVADSGERKSQLDKQFMGPIEAYVSKRTEDSRPLLKEFEARKSCWEAKRSALLELVKKATKASKTTAELENQLERLQQREPVQPGWPRILLKDDTPEKLLHTLAKVWPSAGIISSEAGVIFGAHGMNPESVMRSLAQLNVLWDGGTLDMGRKVTESVHVSGARLTLGLQIQEATLRAFFDRTQGLARGTGFLARFLIAWPESTIGNRMFTEPPDKWPALTAFNDRIIGLLDMPLPLDGRTFTLCPKTLALSPPAKNAWVKYHDAIESTLRCGGELHDIKDVAAKSGDNAVRLAALFHTFLYGTGGEIGLDVFESAAQITAWHLNEALRFFGEICMAPELSNAIRLDAWLLDYCRQNRTNETGTGIIQQYGPNGLRNKNTIESTVNELADLDRARFIKTGKRKIVQVNPALLQEVSA